MPHEFYVPRTHQATLRFVDDYQRMVRELQRGLGISADAFRNVGQRLNDQRIADALAYFNYNQSSPTITRSEQMHNTLIRVDKSVCLDLGWVDRDLQKTDSAPESLELIVEDGEWMDNARLSTKDAAVAREQMQTLNKPWEFEPSEMGSWRLRYIGNYRERRVYFHDVIDFEESQCKANGNILRDVRTYLQYGINETDMPGCEERYYIVLFHGDLKVVPPKPTNKEFAYIHIGACPEEYERSESYETSKCVHFPDSRSTWFKGRFPIYEDSKCQAIIDTLPFGRSVNGNHYIYADCLGRDNYRFSSVQRIIREVIMTAEIPLEECAEQLYEARSKTIDDLRKRYRDANRRLEELQIQTAGALCDIESINKLLMASEGPMNMLRLQIKEEMRKIIEMEQVVRAYIDSCGRLVVFTDTLYCEDSRTNIIHKIGKFKIEIALTPGECDDRAFNWQNLDGVVDAMDPDMNAPHVYNDGHGCLGDLASIYPSALKQFEIVALVGLAIQFIENANVHDPAGMKVYRWEVAATDKQRFPLPEGVEPEDTLDWEDVVRIAKERNNITLD